MIVYQGGPMRGFDNYNFQAFENGREYLMSLGHDVISPHDIDIASGWVDVTGDWADPDVPLEDARFLFASVELTETFDFAKAIRRDVSAMMTADAVSFLPGWTTSEGCLIEEQVRRLVKLPRYQHGKRPDGSWYFVKDCDV